jgi:dienelactone hydrolase
MTQLSYRPLMHMDDVGGFLCDWHLAGPFDSDIGVDWDAYALQPKPSPAWLTDHLAPWGGCAGVTGVPAPTQGLRWNWDLLPLTWRARLSLQTGAQEFPRWAELMEGLDPNRWMKLYYAMAIVESPREMEAELVFCGWDGCKLWINGRQVFDEHSYHHIVIDLERAPFRLAKGLNTFLFQLDRGGVAARISLPGDPAGLQELRSVALSPAPEPRRVGTMAQLRRLAAGQKVRMPFTDTTPQELSQWQEKFYAHYARCLADAPLDHLPAGAAKLVSTTQREGYVEYLYDVPSDSDSLMPGHVLVPEKSRRNGRALVVLHGHEDYRLLLGRDGNTPENPFRDHARQLAQRGFIVAVTCERGFSVRADLDREGDLCDIAAKMAQAQGCTLPRLHIADVQILRDLLAATDGVDERRIGLTGLSGGGTLTYLTAAFDRRFAAAAEFCGLCRYTEYAAGPDGCGMQTVPMLFPTGDTGEILSLIAPRPLLLGQGRRDAVFHTIGVRSIAADALRAYRAAGVPDRLEVAIFDRAHELDVDIAERFFLQWL